MFQDQVFKAFQERRCEGIRPCYHKFLLKVMDDDDRRLRKLSAIHVWVSLKCTLYEGYHIVLSALNLREIFP